MNAKEALFIGAILVLGAVLNYGYPVVANALGIPAGIEFVIVAYCLVVMLLPLSIPELVVIGILSGILNILSNPAHVATILGGKIAASAGILALSNLVSEPVGILACFSAFTYLAGRTRTGAPFLAAFVATIASGLVYLLAVLVLNPGILVDQPGYTGMFLIRVGEAATANAVVAGVLFLAIGGPVKMFMKRRAG